MVDTLDQDLELDGDDDKTEEKTDDDKKDKPTLTSVGLKENIKKVNAK